MTADRPMWQRVRARMPMTIALAGVAAVWVFGCVWSFAEQRAYATAKRFGDPALFPLVLDGLAASMAGVAFAASLDGRPAVAARIGTALAVLASAASNGSWAAERSAYDPATIAMGVVMPIAANIAFEVLLGELRRQVQRGRGLPAPVAVPTLRLIRLVLAPWGTFTTWRRTVLDLTALDAEPAAAPADVSRVVPVRAVLRLLPPPPRQEEQEEQREQPVEQAEEPAGDEQETESDPPALTGHKMNDARAWYRHERTHGRTPLPVHVNERIGSSGYVKSRDTERWDAELADEEGDRDELGERRQRVAL